MEGYKLQHGNIPWFNAYQFVVANPGWVASPMIDGHLWSSARFDSVEGWQWFSGSQWHKSSRHGFATGNDNARETLWNIWVPEPERDFAKELKDIWDSRTSFGKVVIAMLMHLKKYVDDNFAKQEGK